MENSSPKTGIRRSERLANQTTEQKKMRLVGNEDEGDSDPDDGSYVGSIRSDPDLSSSDSDDSINDVDGYLEGMEMDSDN
jgi:hypothetical protein